MAATPRDAAVVVLMRERARAGPKPEVLLLKRHAKAECAAGAYGFPGGRLDAMDSIPAALALSRGFSATAAASLMDVTSTSKALGFWIAALRQAFEETGILLARYGDGRLWQPTPRETSHIAANRRALQQGVTTFANLMHDLERALATDLLVYFAHWITPEIRPLRFSTRFFLAHVPSGLTAQPESVDVGDAVWIPPEEALQRHARGEMEMMAVTTKLLQRLSPFPSALAAVEHFRDVPVETVLPKAVRQEDGSSCMLYPGDEGY